MQQDNLNIKQDSIIKNPEAKGPCSCGLHYIYIDHYSVNDFGVWFNCDCGSTRLIPINLLTLKDKSTAVKILAQDAE